MINLPPRRQLADPGSTGRQLSSSSFDAASNALGGIGQAVGGIGKKLAAHQVKMNRAANLQNVAERTLELEEMYATFNNELLTTKLDPQAWGLELNKRFSTVVDGFDESKGALSKEAQPVFDTKMAEWISRKSIDINAKGELTTVTRARQAGGYVQGLALDSQDREGYVGSLQEQLGGGLITQAEYDYGIVVGDRTLAEGEMEAKILGSPLAMDPDEIKKHPHLTPDVQGRLLSKLRTAKSWAQTDNFRDNALDLYDPEKEVDRSEWHAQVLAGQMDPNHFRALDNSDRATWITDRGKFNTLTQDVMAYDPAKDSDGTQIGALYQRAKDDEYALGDGKDMVRLIDAARDGKHFGAVPKDLTNEVRAAIKTEYGRRLITEPTTKEAKEKDTKQLAEQRALHNAPLLEKQADELAEVLRFGEAYNPSGKSHAEIQADFNAHMKVYRDPNTRKEMGSVGRPSNLRESSARPGEAWNANANHLTDENLTPQGVELTDPNWEKLFIEGLTQEVTDGPSTTLFDDYKGGRRGRDF